MSWIGYHTLDGAEFINTARFEAYAAAAPWFHPASTRRADLAWVLGETYTDPATDLAPWYDPDVPASADFWGFYPISVDGLENSTRSSDPTESTRDGGVPGRLRHALKPVVYAGFIAGSSEEAVEYGMGWLRRTLISSLCSPLDAREQGLGSELAFMAHQPQESLTETPQAVFQRLKRRLHDVAVNVGPTVSAKRTTDCGDHIWLVQFTANGDPHIAGADQWVLTEYQPLVNTGTWDPAVTAGPDPSALRSYREDACNPPSYQPLYDPTCAIVITPPAPPDVPFGCWTPPEQGDIWRRLTVTIPEQNFPDWVEVLPSLVLHSVAEIRDLRVRFYRDEDGLLDPDTDPCSALTDMVVSYIPANSEMWISGLYEEVYVTLPGGHRRRADSLVFSTDMKPPTWPVLACGHQHLMTLEVRGEEGAWFANLHDGLTNGWVAQAGGSVSSVDSWLRSTGAGGVAIESRWDYVNQDAVAAPGQDWSLSGLVRTSDPMTVNVSVVFLNNLGNQVGIATDTVVVGAGEETFSVTGTAPANTVSANVKVASAAAVTAGDYIELSQIDLWRTDNIEALFPEVNLMFTPRMV